MARVTVRTPVAWRGAHGVPASVLVEAGTVGDALAQLTARGPDLRAALYDRSGRLRRTHRVFLNSLDVRGLEAESTRVSEGDEVTILDAPPGG